MSQALTIGLRANTITDPRYSLDAVRQLAEHPEYAVHVLTPRTQLNDVLGLLAAHGIPAEANSDPDRQFWNETGAVLVTDTVVQGDIRIGRGIALYEGDWQHTLQQVAAYADGKPRQVLSRYDGVIHDRQGWQGGKLQEAVAGAPEALRSLLDAGHMVHISTQRAVKQLPEIAQWLTDRDVPAVAASDVDAWERTGTVLVTSGVLPTDAEIENRAVNLIGGDWEPVMAEVARRYKARRTDAQ
ncbi:hypothetical protein [Streptomyces lydicus]|uniref:hypothetical protein n=1 Tax=Streptomyces lydicus TaxID=47763 RepID=UPI001012AA9C|nr:hypothetical protein [Streptomyces lydicus]MCZ1012254.1 hypothetical protein [Streptomyces lydicus]